jgi:hypothetical protein
MGTRVWTVTVKELEDRDIIQTARCIIIMPPP